MENVTQKPWGYEVLWALTDKYAAKMLYIKGGHRLSLQYHEDKAETILVDKGRIRLEFCVPGDPAFTIRNMIPGETFQINPGVVHRFEALEDTRLVEVSTPELDDVVRLEDDYGREDD